MIPQIKITSIFAQGGFNYYIEGIPKPDPYSPTRTLASQIFVPSGYYSDRGDSTAGSRYLISKWLRDFADAFERNSEESDLAKIARLEKELNEERTAKDQLDLELTALEIRVDTAIEALNQ